jgi:hypothetical protein
MGAIGDAAGIDPLACDQAAAGAALRAIRWSSILVRRCRVDLTYKRKAKRRIANRGFEADEEAPRWFSG